MNLKYFLSQTKKSSVLFGVVSFYVTTKDGEKYKIDFDYDKPRYLAFSAPSFTVLIHQNYEMEMFDRSMRLKIDNPLDYVCTSIESQELKPEPRYDWSEKRIIKAISLKFHNHLKNKDFEITIADRFSWSNSNDRVMEFYFNLCVHRYHYLNSLPRKQLNNLHANEVRHCLSHLSKESKYTLSYCIEYGESVSLKLVENDAEMVFFFSLNGVFEFFHFNNEHKDIRTINDALEYFSSGEEHEK